MNLSRLLFIFMVTTAILSAIVFIVPDVIILGLFMMILPGLVLIMAPNALAYLVIFSVPWFILRPWSKRAGTLIGLVLVAAVAIIPPLKNNADLRASVASAAKRDFSPTRKIASAEVITILQPSKDVARRLCDDLCLTLLYNGAANTVIVSTSTIDARGVGADLPPRAYSIEKRSECPAVEIPDQNRWFRQAPMRDRDLSISSIIRLRIAEGECLVSRRANLADTGLVIKRYDEKIGADGQPLSMTNNSFENQVLEVAVDGKTAARKSMQKPQWLVTPLIAVPDFGYLDVEGWELWRRSAKQPDLDGVAVLRSLTSLPLDTPQQVSASALRKRIDAALAGNLDPESDARFALIPDLLNSIRRDGPDSDDAGRFARMVSDRRLAEFWKYGDAIAKLDSGTDELRDAMLRRILAEPENHEIVAGLDSAMSRLPPDNFRAPNPLLDRALGSEYPRRNLSRVIARLSDRGPAATGKLLQIFEAGLRSEERPRSDFGGAMRGLCRLGADARAALPRLNELARQGVVPKSMAETDAWRITLVALGENAETFSLRENMSGSVEHYRTRLVRSAKDCRF